MVKKQEKLIRNPHADPDPDKNQKFITSRASPVAHIYRVWSTSVPRSWVILLTVRLTDRRK